MTIDDLDLKIPSLDIAAAEVDNIAPPTDEERAANPKGKERYSFTIVVKNGDGSIFKGDFTNRILAPEERLLVGVLANKLVLGQPWALIDVDTAYLATQLAHLRKSLAVFPEGFKLADQKNLRVIDKIWSEVLSHESYFRGPDEDSTTSSR